MGLINLVRFSLILTLMVIMLGAYTRLADAGLGCPDWPGCYGHLTVPTDQHEIALANTLYPSLTIESNKAWLEMVHRYFAGTLGLVVFLISVLTIKTRMLPPSLPIFISLVVVFQALLGMWTVTMKLMPVVVMGHLLGGFTLLSLLAILYWRLCDKTYHHRHFVSSKRLRNLALFCLGLIVVQIGLGGWTSSNYAALMCTSLPICEGDWVNYLNFEHAFQLIQPEQDSYEFGTLDYDARMTIHITHRFGALLVTVFSSALLYMIFSRGDTRLKRAAMYMLLMLLLQISLGLGNVLLSLPLVVAVGHNIAAAMLLLSVLHVNYLLVRQRQNTVSTTHIFSQEGSL
ncbi:COX15/CtaA family protein [Vibrio ostreicida]|uniref:COX15/CtaA family protein n=1 Tax=Vibrio ostreicida TaxID=526588 RepID=A0ABT8BY52_9VIBR|nr:COX15/CtaA family protein [Vibrio ostreicida]MDN3611986.1 COX15/CtaA family protein [Vibrio ostreicida]NPD08840.1 COX15/CtaA family protein [Vibrio ostreicida]